LVTDKFTVRNQFKLEIYYPMIHIAKLIKVSCTHDKLNLLLKRKYKIFEKHILQKPYQDSEDELTRLTILTLYINLSKNCKQEKKFLRHSKHKLEFYSYFQFGIPVNWIKNFIYVAYI